MSEYILNPGGGADERALMVGHVPDRKQQALCIRNGSSIRVAAYFKRDEDADEIEALLSRMLTTVAAQRIDGLIGLDDA